GHDDCEECASSCNSCSEPRCTGCLERSALCQDGCCTGCLEETEASGRDCCPSCRYTCRECAAVFASDEAADGSSLCPECRPRPPGACPPGAEPTPCETDSYSPVTECPDATALDVSA